MQGYGQQGINAYQQGLGQANTLVGQGLQYGQGAINQGLGQAGQTLGGVTGLAGQFTPGATNAVQTQQARSRLGEMYEGNFNLQMDPGYQFRQQQGEEALGRMASAQGGRLGGAAQGLAEFNSNLASQEYGAAFNRQMALQGARTRRPCGVRAAKPSNVGRTAKPDGPCLLGYVHGPACGDAVRAGGQIAGLGRTLSARWARTPWALTPDG